MAATQFEPASAQERVAAGSIDPDMDDAISRSRAANPPWIPPCGVNDEIDAVAEGVAS